MSKPACWGLLEGEKAKACGSFTPWLSPLSNQISVEAGGFLFFLPFQSTLCDVEDGARQAASWLHRDLFSHESSLRTQGIYINQVTVKNEINTKLVNFLKICKDSRLGCWVDVVQRILLHNEINLSV